MLYEALSGVNPVRGGGAGGDRAPRSARRCPPLARLRRDLPPELCDAIDRAVLPAPGGARHARAAEPCAGGALRELDDEPGTVGPGVFEAPRAWRSPAAAAAPGAPANALAAAAAGSAPRRARCRPPPLAPRPGTRAAVGARARRRCARAARRRRPAERTSPPWRGGLAALGAALQTLPTPASRRCWPPASASSSSCSRASAGLPRPSGPSAGSPAQSAARASAWPCARRALFPVPPALPLPGRVVVGARAWRRCSGWSRWPARYPRSPGQASTAGAARRSARWAAWWLLLAEPLAARTLLLGRAPGVRPHGEWAGSASAVVEHVLRPLATSGAVAIIALWALAAFVLPLPHARARRPRRRAWAPRCGRWRLAGGTALIANAVPTHAGTSTAALLGAALAAPLALVATAARARSRSPDVS